ncbi:MAG: cysteine hydrolase [Thermoplasmata archaeon]|nr:MAG: cysteine hydrolase [Thermoplasmata archaeon]
MTSDIALLIIDMQNDVVEKMPLAPGIVPGIQEILERFRTASKPVFHIRRSYRADGTNVELPRLEEYKKSGFKVVEGTTGAEIIEALKPQENEYVVIKPRWSAFFQTPLQMLLTRLGIKTVVLTGVQTPNCVRTTAYDAIALDFETIIIKDCGTAATEEIHEYNLNDMENIGCRIMMKDDFLKILD